MKKIVLTLFIFFGLIGHTQNLNYVDSINSLYVTHMEPDSTYLNYVYDVFDLENFDYSEKSIENFESELIKFNVGGQLSLIT